MTRWTPWKSFRKSAKPLKADTPDWLKLWAIGRYDLRLSEEEFWDLSWEQLEALIERHSNSVEREDYHAALICAVLANIHRAKSTSVFKPSDFMPKTKEEQKQTPDQMLETVKMYQKYFEVIDG